MYIPKYTTVKEFTYFADMFTGIITATGRVQKVESSGSNRILYIQSAISSQLEVDQSVSHSGVCLTVETVRNDVHSVTAIKETLKKTNLRNWQEGTLVNLELCLTAGSRLDGHFVQGHVDCVGKCKKIKDKKGSWQLTFSFPKKYAALVIEKGSICINGVSLTCYNVKKNAFTVAIIPFTFEHTNLQIVKVGDRVNIEFDLLGKYLLRRLSLDSK
ncbi:MAG: riboflavin synthase [Chitinophagaceae bacterium]